MVKILKYSYIVEEFLKRGYVLLEETYKNNSTPMSYICKCGNKSEISYNIFTKTTHCMKCRRTKKTDIEDAKKRFLDKGCVLLEETYKNSHALMSYICKCGNKSKISYANFKIGARCADCGGNKKPDIKDVKDKFLKGGCELLEITYKNSKTKMVYRCKCGNTSTISYSNFKLGKRCAMCKNKTELIVNDFLESNYCNIISQPKFEWCKNKKCLPFDFLLDDLKILIEVDGPQHFNQVSNWDSPEKTLQTDIFKTKSALKHGYSVIRICQADIYYNTIDWKTLLNDAVKYCSKIDCVFISKESELYNNHKAFV